MENAADALKMAGAAMLFVLAFTITMMMFGRAKTTTDAVLDNLTIRNYMPRVNPLAGNQTRKVGIETIIPTLYRYCQSDENPTIIIRKKDGSSYTITQIFDTEIEAIARRDFDPNNTDTQETKNYYADLKNAYGDVNKSAYLYGAPWVNQQSKQYYFERINAYVYGTACKHIPALNVNSTSVYANKGNTLMALKDKEFIESYIEYNIGGQVEKDEYGEEIVTRPASKKTQIIYTYN